MNYLAIHKLIAGGREIDLKYGESVKSADPSPRYQCWTNKPIAWCTRWSGPLQQVDDGLQLKRAGTVTVDGLELTKFESPYPVVAGPNWLHMNMGNNVGAEEIAFQYAIEALAEPLTRGAKSILTKTVHKSLPRPTEDPDDGRNTIELRNAGEVVDGVRVEAGGEMVFQKDVMEADGTTVYTAKGTRLSCGGTAFQMLGERTRLSNIIIACRTTGYAIYVRPSAKGFVIDNVMIAEGSECEANLRLGGANGRISRLTCISTGPGRDRKRTRTGIRGYTANVYFEPGIEQLDFEEQLAKHGVVIDDFLLSGVANGLNAMSEGDSGPLDGITHLMQLTTGRPMSVNWEGDWNRVGVDHPNAKKCVDAFLAGKAAGKTAEQIVADCIAASGVSGPDVQTCLESRRAKLGQRAYARWTNGKVVSREWIFNLGGTNDFENVEFVDVTAKVMDVSPQRGGFVPGHPNKDWEMPGDINRPLPKARFRNCTVRGKQITTTWLTGAEIRSVFP